LAEKEIYRLDLVIGADGIEGAKKELRAFDKYVEQSAKRAAMLSKMQITPAARLNDRVSAPAEKIRSTLRTIDRTEAKPRVSLLDRVSGAARVVRSTLTGIARTSWTTTVRIKDLTVGAISRIKNALFSLPSLLGLGAGAYGGIIAPMNLSGQMEQSEIAFETMLGSAAKAKSFMADLMDFANDTPFEFPELQNSSKKLLAFGFAADQILPMMTAIGNASAGLSLGGEGINRISTALGQMRAKSKVSAEEMLQLTEAGIPAWDILAAKMKTSTAAAMDLASKGVIPADKAIDALIEGMNERFPNLMEKQSHSLIGLWSNIKDVFNNKIVTRWGDGIRASIQPRLQQLSDWFTSHPEVIQRWGDKLEKTAEKATKWVTTKFKDAFDYVKERYLDNPEFQQLDFGGKVEFVVNDLADQLKDWYNDTGRDKLIEFGKMMGSALAQGIGVTIQEGFKFLVDVNKEAVTNPSKETLGAAAGWNFAALAGGAYVAQRLGIFKLLKVLFGKDGAAKVATSAETTAATSSSTMAASEAGSATARAASRWGAAEVIPGGAATTANAVRTTIMSRMMSGAMTAAEFGWRILAPEFMAPMLAGQYLSDVSAENLAAKRAAFVEQFKDDPAMLEWGKLPEYERMGVNQSDLSGNVSTNSVDFFAPDSSATVELSDEQLDNITAYLQGLKAETTNEIYVNVPPGAVNLQIQDKSELDYDEISKVVGKLFSDSIRRVIANQP